MPEETMQYLKTNCCDFLLETNQKRKFYVKNYLHIKYTLKFHKKPRHTYSRNNVWNSAEIKSKTMQNSRYLLNLHSLVPIPENYVLTEDKPHNFHTISQDCPEEAGKSGQPILLLSISVMDDGLNS